MTIRVTAGTETVGAGKICRVCPVETQATSVVLRFRSASRLRAVCSILSSGSGATLSTFLLPIVKCALVNPLAASAHDRFRSGTGRRRGQKITKKKGRYCPIYRSTNSLKKLDTADVSCKIMLRS